MNPQLHLAADLHRQPSEHVERVDHAPVRRVLDRHHAIVGLVPIHLLERSWNGSHRHELDRAAEVGAGREMAVAIRGSQVSDLERLDQRSTTTRHLAQHDLDRLGVHRTLARFDRLQQPIVVAVGVEDRIA